ncbi:protein-glutamate O-methyltransferase CheR [uncultured Roseovarius sp.]|uniref:CheR family methyltransferase n=1 Tax=uncultured Roseovarius sp. TaxID=293344 RepID=UPI0026057A30|nr:protein-glutamate O-methyltransferase CheR [uncultured Roseovarius sp.]
MREATETTRKQARRLDLEEIELDLLLEGIQRHYGYDFRDYARASIIRRVEKFSKDQCLNSISALQEQVLHNNAVMSNFVDTISVNVTTMFRNAEFFQAFRKHAVPRLQTYPYLRFWLAGCSTGEEAFSLAILLHEEGLLERSRIYATDFSSKNIQRAKRGVFPLKSMKDYTRNYIRAGGVCDFSEYYSAQYDQAKLKSFISSNISFAQHNLVTDQSFNEFHVILCRNVMIYFNKQLQEHVMNLFHDSIAPLGFLGLGIKEAIFPTSFRSLYAEQGEGTRLFQVKN